MDEQNHKGGSPLHQLESFLEEYLGRKAPQMPDNWRHTIAKIMPWITVVIMVLALPAILFVLGVGVAFAPWAYSAGYHSGGMYTVTLALTVIMIVLEIIALPALFKLQMKGWRLIYYAALIGVVSDIVGFNLGGLVGSIIGLYILFQIKKVYHA